MTALRFPGSPQRVGQTPNASIPSRHASIRGRGLSAAAGPLPTHMDRHQHRNQHQRQNRCNDREMMPNERQRLGGQAEAVGQRRPQPDPQRGPEHIGSEEDRLEVFRRVRDGLRQQVFEYLETGDFRQSTDDGGISFNLKMS